ncbi:hypothetical protein CFBP6109_01300 [Pseudomonas syringae pv. cerasicola]|nr:hypothetical protein CFBP6109_01300 [Pseudomonas syringae pv. cerasicola]
MTLCVTDLRRTITFKIGRRASRTACDAERRTIIKTCLSRASHGSWDYRSARSSVGMQCVTLCVTDLRRTITFKIGRRASRTACDAERRTIIKTCLSRASHGSWDYRSARSSVGMQCVTLCVTDLRRTITFKIGRRASRTACDAERRTIIKTCLSRASHGSWDYRSARSSVGMPCVTLCVTDLRRTITFKIGRRASRTACEAERRTMIKTCLSRASHGSWDYRSARSSV